jgi:hypothetical protein
MDINLNQHQVDQLRADLTDEDLIRVLDFDRRDSLRVTRDTLQQIHDALPEGASRQLAQQLLRTS